VTFNYDTMLEDALQTEDMSFHRVNDYVADPRYKVIKLHGSVNWARPVLTPLDNPVSPMSDQEVMEELIGKAPDLRFAQSVEIIDQLTCKRGDRALFPALAIPTESKTDYGYPPHVDNLTSLLGQITKVMIIGWRANEKAFLQLLSRKLEGAPKIAIVAGSAKGGTEVKEELVSAGIQGYGKDFHNITIVDGGFSGFVRGEADQFLSTSTINQP
jgi:hypothetical protein